MNVEIRIVEGPLSVEAPAWSALDAGSAGAVVRFDGVVRCREGERDITALDYEVYEPMALRLMRQLAEELTREFGLLGVYAEHSRGHVPVGRCSFRLRIASEHRKAALRAADAFVDQLKRDVPIWKSAVYIEDGSDCSKA